MIIRISLFFSSDLRNEDPTFISIHFFRFVACLIQQISLKTERSPELFLLTLKNLPSFFGFNMNLINLLFLNLNNSVLLVEKTDEYYSAISNLLRQHEYSKEICSFVLSIILSFINSDFHAKDLNLISDFFTFIQQNNVSFENEDFFQSICSTCIKIQDNNMFYSLITLTAAFIKSYPSISIHCLIEIFNAASKHNFGEISQFLSTNIFPSVSNYEVTFEYFDENLYSQTPIMFSESLDQVIEFLTKIVPIIDCFTIPDNKFLPQLFKDFDQLIQSEFSQNNYLQFLFFIILYHINFDNFPYLNEFLQK